MTVTLAHDRFRLRASQPICDSFAQDVHQGLSVRPKELHCRYFYDEEGSRLFESICQQPEYYLTRAEGEILKVQASHVAANFGPAMVVELGSGSAVKTRLLLQAFLAEYQQVTYVPIDISPTMLLESSRELLNDYPGLTVEGISGEYSFGLRQLQIHFPQQPKLILWLGSNVGNLHRQDAIAFVREISATMAPNDRLLLGVDLVKEATSLEQAYNDRAGVTAEFNLNLLRRINRELGANFAVEAFAHRSLFNSEQGRVEMYLDSLRPQQVQIGGTAFDFLEGESIFTENSYKYSLAQIQALAQGAAMTIHELWQDEARRFALVCLGRTL